MSGYDILFSCLNRLSYVDDASGATASYDDIEPMTSQNYYYDKLGQLTSDLQEHITLQWRSGDKKLKAVIGMASKENIEFVYNPLGQRVLKVVKPKVGGTVSAESAWTYTYYAYDANGQVMSTYEVAYGTYTTAKLNEQMIYGAGRLGYKEKDELIYTTQFALPAQGDIYTNTLGEKRYELTNHLGNVVAVISDRKLATSGGTPSTYEAVILMKSDYYPFGMTMPDRYYLAAVDAYRFGYNGMEQDPEMKGQGNSYDYGSRMYDPRLGRWLSLDPFKDIYPSTSPYVYALNTPIAAKDPDGNYTIFVNGFVGPASGGGKTRKGLLEGSLW